MIPQEMQGALQVARSSQHFQFQQGRPSRSRFEPCALQESVVSAGSAINLLDTCLSIETARQLKERQRGATGEAPADLCEAPTFH